MRTHGPTPGALRTHWATRMHAMGNTWGAVGKVGDTWGDAHALGDTWGKAQTLGDREGNAQTLSDTWVMCRHG